MSSPATSKIDLLDSRGSSMSMKKMAAAAKPELKSLQEQARAGSWRSLLEAVKEARKSGAYASPEEHMAYATYHVLALAKLGNYAAAAEQLGSLGDLEHAESSTVPFGLRLLHAILPHRLGQTPTSLQRLYWLLDHCKQKQGQNEHEQDQLQSSDPDDDEERWSRRYATILSYAMNLHLLQKDYVLALRLLDQMLAKRPQDEMLWSKFGYIQLQLGDTAGAKDTFAKVEAIVKESSSSSSEEALLCLVGRNKGLECFVNKQYAAAVKALNAVLEMNPGDGVAANNKALCLMYSRDLIRATQVLEDMLQKHTVAALAETLVLNLCSMYELAAVNSTESKRTLSSWIIQVAPDDFDLTCTRL